MSPILRKTKTENVSKLRREFEVLERGMQRVRTKLDRLHQDPAQTYLMSIIGMRPKELIGQYDYHYKDQGRIQASHENDICIDPYNTK